MLNECQKYHWTERTSPEFLCIFHWMYVFSSFSWLLFSALAGIQYSSNDFTFGVSLSFLLVFHPLSLSLSLHVPNPWMSKIKEKCELKRDHKNMGLPLFMMLLISLQTSGFFCSTSSSFFHFHRFPLFTVLAAANILLTLRAVQTNAYGAWVISEWWPDCCCRDAAAAVELFAFVVSGVRLVSNNVCNF